MKIASDTSLAQPVFFLFRIQGSKNCEMGSRRHETQKIEESGTWEMGTERHEVEGCLT